MKMTSAASAVDDVQGKCQGCGKRRALKNGLLITHQKGLGKVCSGSRKKPV
jgi:tetrahydromethanopterin S-methyltransferase subunit F